MSGEVGKVGKQVHEFMIDEVIVLLIILTLWPLRLLLPSVHVAVQGGCHHCLSLQQWQSSSHWWWLALVVLALLSGGSGSLL